MTADLVQGTLWTRDVDVMLFRLERATDLHAQFGYVVWESQVPRDEAEAEIGDGWTAQPGGD